MVRAYAGAVGWLLATALGGTYTCPAHGTIRDGALPAPHLQVVQRRRQLFVLLAGVLLVVCILLGCVREIYDL